MEEADAVPLLYVITFVFVMVTVSVGELYVFVTEAVGVAVSVYGGVGVCVKVTVDEFSAVDEFDGVAVAVADKVIVGELIKSVFVIVIVCVDVEELTGTNDEVAVMVIVPVLIPVGTVVISAGVSVAITGAGEGAVKLFFFPHENRKIAAKSRKTMPIKALFFMRFYNLQVTFTVNIYKLYRDSLQVARASYRLQVTGCKLSAVTCYLLLPYHCKFAGGFLIFAFFTSGFKAVNI